MKPAESIIAELAARDIKLQVEDGRLRVNAPRGALTAELREVLTARKDDLIALLQAQPSLAAPGIPRLPRTEPLPMSFGQQRLWFLTRMTPESALFNLPISFRLTGPLDVPALQRSLCAIVARHEVLRTTLGMSGEMPVQTIHPPFDPCPVVEDETHSSEPPEAVAARVVKEDLARPFDLETSPPFRARLVRLGSDDHLLHLTLHHSAGDGWSLGVLQRELAAFYTAFRSGTTPALPKLAIQYADFAAWQRATLDAAATERALGYWRTQLAGLEPSLDLPTDRPRPPVQSTAGSIAFRMLPVERFERLRKLATQHRVTRFMTLLAIWGIVLSRYSGRSDVAVGTPVTNRGRRDLEDLIGFFVNSLVLRLNVTQDLTFAELLVHARQVTLDAYAHQDLPFEQLVEELRPARDLSRHPLFQAEFVVHAEPHGGLLFPGVSAAPAVPGYARPTALDLSLEITDHERAPSAVLIYNTDLFDVATAERLLDYYELLLNAVTANADVKLSQLPALLPGDEAQLRAWNAKMERPIPAARGVHELFEAQVLRTPSRTAVVAGQEALTYAELDRRANAFAKRLQDSGFRPGSVAGVYMERSSRLLPTLLGIFKAGGGYLPLDPAFPRDRIAYMLEDSGAEALIVDNASAPTAPPFPRTVISVDDPYDPAGMPDRRYRFTGEEISYVLYTSGSTGRPKGVAVPQRSLVNLLATMPGHPGFSESDRLVAVTTLSFDISVVEMFLPVTCGATVYVATRDVAADPARLTALMDTAGATVLQATPATFRMLLDAGWQGAPHLRVICGGEAMSEEMARALYARTAEAYNLYGPTETTIWSTGERVPPDGRVTIGGPMPNTFIYVLDPSLRPVPIGAVGEIYLGGEGVARGYLDRPDLTAERFLPDPWTDKPGTRMYRTGDLGRFDRDGRLHYLGRMDRQVKIRGFRIELGEIETILSSQPGVAQAVALVREDSPGDARLVAYIVPAPGAGDLASDLKQAVTQFLPQYMRPSAYVMLDALPRLPNGKVDRRSLPAPEGGSSRVFVAPRNPIEEALAEAWQRVFKVERVGVDDDFFELGGHSLMAIQVLSRVREEFDVEVPLVALFEAPTVAGLSLAIMERLMAAEDATAT